LSDLDFLENLYRTVKTYKSTTNYSLFNEISDSHFRENYHSDILALYLKFNEVKKEFITWLNNNLSDKEVNFDEYAEGFVEREEEKIDILLYSSDKKKAIIIENKSNNADDQPKQLFRYYKKLRDENIIVEAIFYLNKFVEKEPDLNELLENEKKELKELLVIGKLVEENSFTENVIKKVIQKTNNIRLNALSQEIMDLFNSVIYGDINMEDLGNFVKELSDNGNLEKFQKTMEAYYDLPRYFVDKYVKYLNSKNTGYKIFIYRNTTLVIDIKTKNGLIFAVDVGFSIDNISFAFWVRDTGNEKNTKEEILEKIKKTAGDAFPFKELIGRRYKVFLKNIFDDNSLTKMFDDIIEFGNKYLVEF
jgi:hypothetical protein